MVRLFVSDRLVVLAFVREIFRMHVGDVQKAVLFEPEVHKRRLDGRLDVVNPPLVNVAHVRGARNALDVEFLQDAVAYDRDTALLAFHHVNQHFF